jgi:zf-MYND-like zinc finger, mRNA-binding/Metallopeptidase family M24
MSTAAVVGGTTPAAAAGTATAAAAGCASPGCTNVVANRLACPKCLQLGMNPPTYFCSQDCFKTNYAHHKQIHTALAQQQKMAMIAAAQAQGYVYAIIAKYGFFEILRNLFLMFFFSSGFFVRYRIQHRKTPPRTGTSCSLDAPLDVKLSLPNWARNYSFTGNLRPTLISPQRIVPASIHKPDYANDIAGISYSEQRDKATHNNIRIYTETELEDQHDDEIPGLRHACRMGREVLDIAGKALRPGITTDEIDRIVHEACIERDCTYKLAVVFMCFYDHHFLNPVLQARMIFDAFYFSLLPLTQHSFFCYCLTTGYPSPLNYYNFPKSVCTSVNEVVCHGIPDYREIQDGGECRHIVLHAFFVR